jgi:hypothetical protein
MASHPDARYILTMTEHHDGSLEKIRTASWATTVATTWPARFWSPERYCAWTSPAWQHETFASPMPWSTWRTGGQPAAARGVLVTDDVELGVGEADFVYTDVWVRTGVSTQEWATWVRLLFPYRQPNK